MSQLISGPLHDDSNTDPRGCYLGPGKIWIETASMTSAFRSHELAHFRSLVKVPASEVNALLRHGVNRFDYCEGQVVARRDSFEARLPGLATNRYVADIQIIDHDPLEPIVAASLVKHVGSAMPFVDRGASNPSYQFIYASEYQVFATDGFTLFVGALRHKLKRRLIFNYASAAEMHRLWKGVVPTCAMQSERSLLLKSDGLASAIRCVDTVIPTTLYRTVRFARRPSFFVRVSKSELTNWLDCIGAADSSRNIHIAMNVNAWSFTADSGSVELTLHSAAKTPQQTILADLIHLRKAISVVKGAYVEFSDHARLPNSLTIADPLGDAIVVISTRKIR